MKRLRFRTILLACSVILFFSIERLSGVVSISSTAYAVVLAMVLVILLAPRVTRIPWWLILTISTGLFLLFKGWTGDLTKSTVAVVVIIEMTGVVVTTLLAYWLSMAIHEFETAVLKITIGRSNKQPEAELEGRGFIYREVRRARNHQRPLALMAIGVNEKSLKFAVDHMVQEVQQAMMKQYKLSGLSKTLCDELEDCAVIVQRDDHFLVALPETKPEELPVIIDRLRNRVVEHVGVDLEFGTAVLPNDSFTFEGLVDKATKDMRTAMKEPTLIDFDRIPSERPVTAAK